MLTIFLIVLLVFAFGGLPQVSGRWHSFGYGPSGIGFVLVIILVVLIFSGRW